MQNVWFVLFVIAAIAAAAFSVLCIALPDKARSLCEKIPILDLQGRIKNGENSEIRTTGIISLVAAVAFFVLVLIRAGKI